MKDCKTKDWDGFLCLLVNIQKKYFQYCQIQIRKDLFFQKSQNITGLPPWKFNIAPEAF